MWSLSVQQNEQNVEKSIYLQKENAKPCDEDQEIFTHVSTDGLDLNQNPLIVPI